MRLTAKAWSGLIEDRPLRWEPPFKSEMKNPEASNFCWRRLQYVFPLPDPRGFTPISGTWSETELAAMKRYVSQAKKLAATTMLTANDSVTINISDDGFGEEVHSELTPDDATAGFMVTLRQFYAVGERASFKTVHGWLMREARTNEPSNADQIDMLKAWGRADGRLRHYALEHLVQEQLVEDGQMPPAALPLSPHHPDHFPNVDLLLNYRWYSDEIHWGERALPLAHDIADDPVLGAIRDLDARVAAVDLAHVYIAFAELVSRQLTR